jgi:NitT/TauT family transport system substrate-binding protein
MKGGRQMTTQSTLKKVRVSMMNAIHDLPLLVARDEGFFSDEGLDVEVITTPGTAQIGADHSALKDNIFARTMEALYDQGACDQYRMCEWGVMKRAVEAVESGQRPAKIVALGSAMSSFAIVSAPDSDIYEPEALKNKPIAVSPFNGSHFTTIKMLESFLKFENIPIVNAGTMKERLDALRRGEVAAASVMEPWISVAQKQGFRIIIESHSTRSEAAGDELDGPTLAAMARAADLLNRDPSPFLHYLVEEAEGLIEASDIDPSRILNAHPQPYTRERFQDTYEWTVARGLVAPGATYEGTVDNRAWEPSP